MPEKADLKRKAVSAVGRLVVEDKSLPAPKSTSSPKSKPTKSQHDITSPSVRPPTKYTSPKGSSSVMERQHELNNNLKSNPSSKYTPAYVKKTPNQRFMSPDMVPTSRQIKPKSSPPNTSRPKPSFSYGANDSHYKSSEKVQKSTSDLDQRQKKRPASPSWYEQYLESNKSNKKAKVPVMSPKVEDDDGWIQGKLNKVYNHSLLMITVQLRVV